MPNDFFRGKTGARIEYYAYISAQNKCMQFRFTLLCCHLVAMLGAQSPQFLHYGLTDGLPSNQVYCVEQDRNGMIWLGTDNGLARFDGRAFRNFQVQDGIPDPEVLNLKTDYEGRLWISCFRKSVCYYKDGRFSTEKNNPVLAKIRFSSAINALFVDTLTGIWFTGTDYTVCNWRAGRVRTFSSQVLTNLIRKIGGDFFAFSRTHIARFDPAAGVLDTVLSVRALIDSTFILRGIAVSGDRVLYSTSRGLWLFEWDGGKFRVVDVRQMEPGNVFVDQRGRFWLGTNTIGAVCFDNLDRNLSNPRVFLPGEKITHVFEDRQGALWFGTTGNGVFVLPPQYSMRFTKEEGLPSNNITAVLRLPDGALLAGDEAGNLLRISNGDIDIRPLATSTGYNRVRSIQRLPTGRCLIVSDYGFYLLQERDRIRFLNGRPSGKAGLIEGGALYAGTSTALESVDLNSLTSNILVRRRTTALAQCDEGVVWQAGVDGLYSGKNQFLHNFSTQFPLLKCRITALEYQKPSTLIIGTSDAGLLKAYIRNGGVDSVCALPTDNRLNPPQIRSLFLDEAGTIWSATPEGVHWLRPDGKRGRVSVFQGLIDNDVNAVWAAKDTLWAATRYGLSIIPLNRLKKNVGFETYFTKLEYRVDRQMESVDLYGKYPNDLEVRLPSNTGTIVIHLAALEYTGKGIEYEIEERQGLLPWYQWTFKNLYRWRFGERDSEQTWRTDESAVNMGANPAPGVYQFAVRAFTADNTPSRNRAALSIAVQPYWYQIIWFWLLLVGLVVAAARALLRSYVKMKSLDSALSNLQLQALQAQINPHFLGNSVNAIQQFFYPPNPAKASEYVGILTDLLRKTMSFSEHHFMPFQEELAYSREYLQLIELRYGDQFRFTISGEEQISPATPFPCMLLQPLLENATLHGLAPDGSSWLKLEFALRRDRLICRIRDNGVGIRASQNHPKPLDRKSKGLELLRRKVETFNRLYDLGLTLDLYDRLHDLGEGRGTCAEISFSLYRLPEGDGWKSAQITTN